MQVLTYIQVLFNATTTTKYAILDLLLLNADTDVSTYLWWLVVTHGGWRLKLHVTHDTTSYNIQHDTYMA